MSKWSKRDYEFVAQTIRDEGESFELDEEMFGIASTVLDELAHCFADKYEMDNPKFDRERFLKACGVV